MSVNFLISQAKNIQIVINENAAEIEALDQNIGDGDHIFNVQRGLKLVVELENDIKNLPLQKGLNMIAMKVLSGIGGSSGALFGTFFMSMAKTPDLDGNIDFNKACEMVITGINAMKERGKADVGEKTMMDVLIPVSERVSITFSKKYSFEDKKFKPNLIAITNRKESSIGRQVANIIDICAGIEVGVAATKTYFAQLLSFYGLAIKFAQIKGNQSPDEISKLIDELIKLPPLLEDLLNKHNKSSEKLAHDFFNIKDVIFLGRGINYPIALEGALKLKEISYIHAAGYPAGEMNHGPIALLDK